MSLSPQQSPACHRNREQHITQAALRRADQSHLGDQQRAPIEHRAFGKKGRHGKDRQQQH